MIQPAGSLWGSNLVAASGRAVNGRLEPGGGALCIGCADAQAQCGNGGKDHGFHVHVDLLIWSAMPCGEAELFRVSMGEDQTTTPFILALCETILFHCVPCQGAQMSWGANPTRQLSLQRKLTKQPSAVPQPSSVTAL